MKVLLKDAQTGLYYKNDGSWVPDVGAAAHFKTMEAAAKMAFSHQNFDVNVVLQYEDPICELALNPAYCVPRRGMKNLTNYTQSVQCA